VPAVHTEALAGRCETCRRISAGAGASGDRVLARYSPLRCGGDADCSPAGSSFIRRDVKRGANGGNQSVHRAGHCDVETDSNHISTPAAAAAWDGVESERGSSRSRRPSSKHWR